MKLYPISAFLSFKKAAFLSQNVEFWLLFVLYAVVSLGYDAFGLGLSVVQQQIADEIVIPTSSLAIIVVPVYGGHVAPLAMERLQYGLEVDESNLCRTEPDIPYGHPYQSCSNGTYT